MVGALPRVEYACGPNANFWIERWFADCVYSPWETVAFFLGLSSVFFWLIAQLPQFISNVIRQSADALSPWFLMQWLAGDSFNLIGCLLTGDQLATQTITASYFIFSDFIIIVQYIYYQIRNRNKPLDVYCSDSDDSLHKPSFGYEDVAKTSGDSALEKLLEQGAYVKLQEANAAKTCLENSSPTQRPHHHLDHDWSSTKSATSRYHVMPDGECCKAQAPVTVFIPGKRNENSAHLWQGMTNLSPVEGGPVTSKTRKGAYFLNNDIRSDRLVGDQSGINVRPISNGAQVQGSAVASALPSLQSAVFPFSVSDFNQQYTWMYEHRHRLRRLIQEYGLEYGHETVSRLNVLHALRNERSIDQRLIARTELHQVPVPPMKAKLKAVIGMTGLIGLGSSRCRIFSNSNNVMDSNLGAVLGRRALLALPEAATTSTGVQNSKQLTFLSTDTSLAAFTGSRFLSASNSTLRWTKLIGRSMGWVSSALYLGSRISQLLKNKRRRSAEGLSLGMVTCAVLANLTYGVSIIMRTSSWEALMAKAPWLVGSLGTVALDFSIFIQAQYYNRHTKKGMPSEYTPLLG